MPASSKRPLPALLAAFVATAATAAAPAVAQSFPSRPIRVLVPFAAGGSSDIVARSVGAKLFEEFGQPIVADNRTGANGSIAAAMLAKSPPDGYTIMVGSIGVFAINVGLYKDLQYDPLRDFAPLTLAVTTPNILIVKQALPAASVKELIAHARAARNGVTWASSGSGSSDHLSAELFKQMTGTTGEHIPYKGGAAAMTDMLGGNVDASFQNLGAASVHVKSGRLRALAVTSRVRNPLFPDVPTAIEAGLPGFEVTSWQAIAAPRGTPPAVVKTLHAALVKGLRSPEVRDRLGQIGFDVVAGTPEEFGALMKSEIERWRGVIQKAGIRLE